MSHAFRTIGWTLRMAVLAVGLLLAASSVQAAIINVTSDDFSFGIGATGTGTAVWTTDENASNNSPTTQGNFTFSPSATSAGQWSSTGCSFPNRTMTANGGVSGYIADGAFGVSVVGSYTGPAPANADPTNPNYQLTLEITGLGIYVSDMPAAYSTAGAVAQWTETTAGHSQASPLTTITTVQLSFASPSDYTHMLWDPADYSVAMTGLNDSVARNFTIPVSGPADTDYRSIDGIEVFGRVSLSYNSAVPEPSTLVMVCAGIVGLMAYAWRRRR